MTDTRLQEVSPADLTVDANVRLDLRLDDHFVKSIKVNGIIQPPVVYPDPDQPGALRVFTGHRRLAAALRLGLDTITVIVRDAPVDDERIVEQLVENIHRDALTPSEQASAYQQLALDFGLPAIQIAKRTATKIDHVGAALKVAGSHAVTDILEHAPQLGLDVLAQIAEFDDDPDAVKKLTTTVTKTPEQLEHVLADLTKKRGLENDRSHLVDNIQAAGITVEIHDNIYKTPDGYHRLKDYAHADTPGEEIPTDDYTALAAIPGIAACVDVDYFNKGSAYVKMAAATWYIADPDAAGLVERQHGTPEGRAEQAERERHLEEAELERAARLEARKAAEQVRHAFIVQLLQRSRIPDVDQFIAMSFISVSRTIAEGIGEYSAGWLGIPVNDNDDEIPAEEALYHALNTDPRIASKMTLAFIIEAHEGNLDHPDWEYRFNATAAAGYLLTLQQWGYGLSEYELAIIDSITEEGDAA